MTPRRIALFTIESYSSGAAVQELITRERDRIAIIVASTKPERDGIVSQTWTHLRRSGRHFVVFLLFNFPLYQAMLSLLHVAEKMFAYPRRHLALREICQRLAIPYMESPDVNSVEVRNVLKDLGVDLILVFYFDQILRTDLIAQPLYGVLNAHAAMLPRCRGLFPVVQGMLRGNEQFGMSVHQISDQRIDAGAILAQQSVALPGGLSALEASRFVHRAGVEVVVRVLKDFEPHWTSRSEQGAGDYFSFPDRDVVVTAITRGVRLSSARAFFREMLSASDPAAGRACSTNESAES